MQPRRTLRAALRAPLPVIAALPLLMSACQSTPRPPRGADGVTTGTEDGAATKAPEGDHRAGAAALTVRAASPEPIDASGATLLVSGLACPKCASNVDVQLARLPGVHVRNVDMKNGLVLVSFNSQPHPTSSQLARAVEDAGLTWRGWLPAPLEGGR